MTTITVGDLRKKLEGLDPKMQVVVCRETDETSFFDIYDVSPHVGNPIRHESGKAGFKIDNNGDATWLFITIDEA